LNGISLGFILSDAAIAGGYGDASYSEFTDESDTYSDSGTYPSLNSPAQSSPTEEASNSMRSLNSPQWSESYSTDDGVCREAEGDIMCLSPNLADNLNW